MPERCEARKGGTLVPQTFPNLLSTVSPRTGHRSWKRLKYLVAFASSRSGFIDETESRLFKKTENFEYNTSYSFLLTFENLEYRLFFGFRAKLLRISGHDLQNLTE